MIHLENFSTIKNAIEALIKCDEDYLQLKQSVDSLYELFKSITGIDINKLNEGDIHLPSGKAISPSGAAHCLLEMKRTAIFLRGIKQAIDTKIASSKDIVRILYAGCGPYATLITPLLQLYSSDKIKVVFLDINEVSLNAAEKLINELGLGNFIERFVLADATTCKLDLPYDIVISETMQAGLKNEPQVAVMQNLIPQCKAETIFIPEEISIDASLTNSKMEQDRMFYYEGEKPVFQRIELGNIFKVTKDNLETSKMRKVINIPADILDFPILKLFTSVTVFKNEVLKENDSSITLPITYCDLRLHKAEQIEFWYNQGNKPVIESKIMKHVSVV